MNEIYTHYCMNDCMIVLTLYIYINVSNAIYKNSRKYLVHKDFKNFPLFFTGAFFLEGFPLAFSNLDLFH